MSVDYRPEYDPADVDSDYGHTGGDITVPTFTANMKPFRFWCQKALPLVYDDSLSYYEVLCKVVKQMNDFLTDLQTATGAIDQFAQQFVINQQFLNDMADQLGQNVQDLEDYINDRLEDYMTAYTQLQNYVNNYFDNLDVQQEINNKLDEMAADGTFNTLFDPVITAWMTAKTAQIDAAIANQDAIQAQQNGRISVLEGRMDTFSGLPSGSTSGNAELLDIRTNFLGEKYPTAGDAVRASDMIASGFQSIGFSRLTEWNGNEADSRFDTIQIDVTAYKGGHMAVIANTYQFVNNIEQGAGIELFGSNVAGKTVDSNAHQYPFPDGVSGIQSPVFKDFTVITTSVQDEERILIQLAIPEDFQYQYLKLGNIAPIPGEGYSYTQPAAIVYANSWSKTQVDPTLSIAGAAADAKATGDALDELNERIDDLLDDVYLTETAEGTTLEISDAIIENIKSIETSAQKIYVTGINIWDEEWELGAYSTANGATVYNQNGIRSKSTNPIPIHPNTDYYVKVPYNMAIMFYESDDTFIEYQTGLNKKITSPANAYYMRFYIASNYGTTYNNDVQITFDSDPEKTTYHPHNNTTFNNPNDVTLIPLTKNYIYAIGSTNNIDIVYYIDSTSQYIPKKPYQSGFIVFTVPSRLTKSNNSVSATSLSEQADDSTDVNCILKLPSTYTDNGNPCKLIMICHGAGQSAQQWATNANYIALTDAFVNAGYAVFDCNGYRENALGYSFWGDSRGVDVWRKAYQYIVDNYNVEHEFGLYGFSMGGLTALNLLFSGFPGIKCVALGSPVVSLEACYNSESTKAVIQVLYGMGNTYNKALAYGCDPFARMINIDNVDYIFGQLPPLKMWYGSTETGTTDTGTGEVVTGVVVKAYGNDIVEAINNAGGQAEYREVENAGHEICYGGNTYVNQDLVLFFNRHNKI